MKIVSFGSVAFMTLMALVLAGCGASQPSENDGETVVRNKIVAQSAGRIKLVGFRKTNGQAREMGGVSIYAMEYEVEIESADDCLWLAGPSYNPLNFETQELPSNWDGGFGSIDTRIPMKKGQHAKIGGTVMFEKTENGWRGHDQGNRNGVTVVK